VLASASEARNGAYVLAEASGSVPAVVLIASGSEIGTALEARETLEAERIATRVVSMPSWYLFSQQDRAYRDLVLPPGVRARVAVEAGSTFGWARWVGDAGTAVGIDHFGASAPAETLYERFGVTPEAVVAAAKAGLEKTATAKA
jgi:transketolase